MPGGAAAYHHCRTVTASSGCGAAIFVQHGHTVASLRCVDTACTTDDITQTFDKCEELVPRQMRWWSNAIGTTTHDGDHQTKIIQRVGFADASSSGRWARNRTLPGREEEALLASELRAHGAIAMLWCCAGLTALVADDRGANWPQFRGPGGSGVVERTDLPDRWSRTHGVEWSRELPGRGWSSPIVWGDRVFVTTAVSSGGFRPPSPGIYGNDEIARLMRDEGLTRDAALQRVLRRDIEPAEETKEIRYLLLALDVTTGDIVWLREAHRGLPFRGRHRKNTYASETPVTDGERVYASFGGNVGLFCYSIDGKLLWSKRWAPQAMYLDFGTAASPVLHDGRVYMLNDNEGESFLAAIDARTGRDLWRVSRTHGDGSKSGWSTPFIWKNSAGTEIVTIGRRHAVSYDLEGRELWRLSGFTQATPSPVASSELLYVGSGSQGESNRPMYAVRPGAKGDISLGPNDSANAHVAWFHPRASAYTSSPLVYRGRMYVVNDNGILTVLDAQTGKEIYKARVGGGGQTFSSSPWAYDGKVFLLTEDGDTFVLGAGNEYREVAKNSLGEMSLATPAIAGDSLFIRTATRLYRIRQPAATSESRGAVEERP